MSNWETPCPKREDKVHCNCWYDGEACCACGAPADSDSSTTKGSAMTNDTNVGMNFGQAVEAVKAGRCVQRAGWNGKAMFIYLNKGSFDHELLGFTAGEHPVANHPSTMDGISLGLFESGDRGTVTRLPNINMRSASGSTVTGWLASQTDMLAEDWQLVAP